MAFVPSTAMVISRREMDCGDRSTTLAALMTCIATPEQARANLEDLDIAFDGYDHDGREIFEIPEVRDLVSRLDAEFPFWLFFMNKRLLGLQAITLCLMPPYLTPDARKKIFPEVLGDLLTKRWLPAMNQVCAYCDFTDDEISDLTDRSLNYMHFGPETG
jgi:hypothetical protein